VFGYIWFIFIILYNKTGISHLKVTIILFDLPAARAFRTLHVLK